MTTTASAPTVAQAAPTSPTAATPAAPFTQLPAPPPSAASELRRRVTYLMLFRVVLISLVMGATAVLYWVSEDDLTAPNAMFVFGIIAFTYLLTIIYAVSLERGVDLRRLGYTQLGGDLLIASLLIHVTGGAQSAYTFFLPLAIIGAATIGYRRAAVATAFAAGGLFLIVTLAGWLAILPAVPGPRMVPSEIPPVDLARLIGLNLAAMVGVAFLAVNLGGQLERASATLATERLVTEDLRVLHGDIVRCLSSGLVTINLDNRVLTINEAACEILRTSPDLAIGSALSAVIPGLAELVGPMAADQSLRRAELAISRERRPSLVLGVSVSPLSDHANRALGRIVNFQDLTEMREMEQSMQRAERLAVIGGLAAGVAHEIRNPLASISGSIELLTGTAAVDDDSRALAEIVHREIARLNTLLSELLDYANPRQLAPAEIDVGELVGETLRVFEQDRDFAGVTVVGDIAPDEDLTVIADPEKLRQVLWNLLRNAAEAVRSDGGKVTIRVAPHADDGVEVVVSDDGPGIPAENLSRVFDPFFTTKQGGSGLGLATVHAIVTDHGGSVHAASESGKGATFIVRLPYTAFPERSERRIPGDSRGPRT